MKIFERDEDMVKSLDEIRHKLMTCDPSNTVVVHECLLDVLAILAAKVATREVRQR